MHLLLYFLRKDTQKIFFFSGRATKSGGGVRTVEPPEPKKNSMIFLYPFSNDGCDNYLIAFFYFSILQKCINYLYFAFGKTHIKNVFCLVVGPL